MKKIIFFGTIGMGFALALVSPTQQQNQKQTDGIVIKSEIVENYFKWVPEELRGGVYRPAELDDKVEGFFYAKNAKLKYALSDWKQLEFDLEKTVVSQVRVFGFAQFNGGEHLDIYLDDVNVIGEFKEAIYCSNIFRPCVSDLGNGYNMAHGALILGVIQVKFHGNHSPILVGVSSKNFSLGVCYGPSSQWFFGPRLAKILDNALMKFTAGENGLPLETINQLQGRKYFEDNLEDIPEKKRE